MKRVVTHKRHRKYCSDYDNDSDKKNSLRTNESLAIDNSKSKDIQSIIDSLSDKDRILMNGMSKGYKLDDSKTVKEFVAYNGKTPVAYFMIDMQKDKTADVSLAVNPYYRHQGYGDKVARQGSYWIDSHIEEFKAVYWATKPNNKFSQKLAEKYGWKLVRDDKDWRTYSKENE